MSVGKSVPQGTANTNCGNKSKSDIPPELLILNRFGIGFPFIKAAWDVAKRHQIDGREVLLRSNIITEKIWLESQVLLDEERARAQARRHTEETLLDQSVNGLYRTQPEMSAGLTFSNWQIALFFTLAGILALLGWHYPQTVILSITFLSFILYTGVIVLRLVMLAWFDRATQNNNQALIELSPDLPVYSILVPLYKESNQVRALVTHLSQLNWPTERLQIFLICERDDIEAIELIYDLALPKQFHLIIVPPAPPKTKPKALNYTLPLCQGQFLVIYDAEDRPHPDQLREAYFRFTETSSKVACLQAPLIIENRDQTWLSRLFFIEYMTLFRGILPVLATLRLPVPLGGTSNHFRMSALREVGGWDPYNVTEDADLGIRLMRHGYECQTITLPTMEEAPPYLIPWIKQRTRWVKGWMQTILVHNRNPTRLVRELGLRNTVAFHLLLTSIIVSSLIHPIALGFALYELNQIGPAEFWSAIITGFGIFNIVAGYTTYVLFADLVLRRNNFRKMSLSLLMLPLYWLLISISGWRALIHLLFVPHQWEKTPHGLSDKSDD